MLLKLFIGGVISTGISGMGNSFQSSVYPSVRSLVYATDTCGSEISHPVSFNGMPIQYAFGNTTPCPGNLFTLTLPYIPLAQYQWTKNDTVVAGSTGNTYSVAVTASQLDTIASVISLGSCLLKTLPYVINPAACSIQSMPITLTSFTAVNNNNEALLKWNTATEINNKGFYAERSADQMNWQDISFVPSQAQNGNSSLPLYYQFTDYFPLEGSNFYRLKQMDIDGTISYSATQLVYFSKEAKDILIYPNPFTQTLHVQINANNANSPFDLINIAGTSVLNGSLHSGDNILNFSSIPQGLYILHIGNKSYQVEKR